MPGLKRIIWVSDLPDTYGPASTVPFSDTVTISRRKWRKLSRHAKDFVMLHENAHSLGIISEEMADAYAFQCFVKGGGNLKEAVYSLTRVLDGKKKEHYIRVYHMLQMAYDANCRLHGKCQPLKIDMQWMNHLIATGTGYL